MKKNLIHVLAVLLMAGITAQAKSEKAEGTTGKPDKVMKQAADQTSESSVKKAEQAQTDAEKAKKEADGKSEQAKEKSKGRSEEMQKATAEKKEAQEAARESGEKMNKEEKSWWKFWK